MDKIKVAGYAKLAKLWENRREEVICFHERYYEELFENSEVFELVGIYVDITANRDIYRRKEMSWLIKACFDGKVDCIVAQTKGYFAANLRDFSYLFKYLMDAGNGGIDFMTEDKDEFHIDTFLNDDDQKGALKEMVEQFISLYPEDYSKWKRMMEEAIEKI